MKELNIPINHFIATSERQRTSPRKKLHQYVQLINIDGNSMLSPKSWRFISTYPCMAKPVFFKKKDQ